MNDKEGQLIGLERKQLARPPLSSITGREPWKGGGGFGDCLIGSWSSGGVSGHAASLPFTVQAGGSRPSCPGPRQPQVGFVVCHHGSCSNKPPLTLLSERQTTSRLICPCGCPHISISVCTFTALLLLISLLGLKRLLEKFEELNYGTKFFNPPPLHTISELAVLLINGALIELNC